MKTIEKNEKRTRIDFEDDLVLVKKGRKIIYQGIEDNDPMKYEDWQFDGKKYTLPGGYTKQLIDIDSIEE